MNSNHCDVPFEDGPIDVLGVKVIWCPVCGTTRAAIPLSPEEVAANDLNPDKTYWRLHYKPLPIYGQESR